MMVVVGLYYNYIHLSSYKGHQGDLGHRVPYLSIKHPAFNKSNSIQLGKWALDFPPRLPLPWYSMV